MSRNLWAAMLVAVVAVLGFIYVGNSIPQASTASAPTPATGARSLVQEGRSLFFGRGSCAVCHTIGQPGGRAPDLQGIGARAAQRRAGLSAEAYLRESLMDPMAYVVEGWPPIMPPANKPPVALSEGDLDAVVAFLQSLGGKVTVTRGAR